MKKWLNPYVRPPSIFHGYAYYSAERNQILWVIYPFNFIYLIAFWLQDKWANHAHAPSWIDQEVTHRTQQSRSSPLNTTTNHKPKL